MVALLVQLKLALLRNHLRRSPTHTVGLVAASALALGLVAVALASLVVLRWESGAAAADVTAVAYAVLTVGWLVLPLVAFGVDETVDPARFALLPVRARELVPGLLAAALVGIPGVSTVLLAAGLVATWARTPALTATAVLVSALGTLTCVLLSRTATAALSAVLSSRRFQDLAAVLHIVVGTGFLVGLNAVLRDAAAHVDALPARIATLAVWARWSPFGWAWALPGDVARGDWLLGFAHLALAAALVLELWSAWAYFLARRLVDPFSGGGGGGAVASSRWVERLYPAGAAGAVAARSLRFWWRDPRQLRVLAVFLVSPLALLALFGIDSSNVGGPGPLVSAVLVPAVLVPATFALIVGTSAAQDLCFDGTALWVHAVSGIAGIDDRKGRVWAALTVFGPLLLVLQLASAAVSGAWSEVPAALGWSAPLGLGGLAVGSWVGTVWQWPGPAPGAASSQGGGLGGWLGAAATVTVLLGSVVVGLPAVALLLASVARPWLAWLGLPVGLLTGLLALRVGLVRGGRRLDRRWPEILHAVTDGAG